MSDTFKPIDLNTGTVNRLFNKCLFTQESRDFIVANMNAIEDGHKEDSEKVYFDADEMERNRQTINYLTGQLLAIQNKFYTYVKITDLFLKYDGEYWTEDGVTLWKYIHLAIANGNLSRFLPETNESRLISYVGNTISPYDSNFEQWYEENKDKFRRKSNYEPDDY